MMMMMMAGQLCTVTDDVNVLLMMSQGHLQKHSSTIDTPPIYLSIYLAMTHQLSMCVCVCVCVRVSEIGTTARDVNGRDRDETFAGLETLKCTLSLMQ